MRVLVVCTGNMCRSPAAELMLVQGVNGAPGLAGVAEVSSAGLQAVVGGPIDLPTQRALVRVGIEVPPHAGRQLTLELLSDADLVLTASRSHRGGVVRLQPQALPHTYTLAESARIAALLATRASGPADPKDALRRLVERGPELRGLEAPARPEDDDIADPHGRSAFIHRRQVRRLASVVEQLLWALHGGRPEPGGSRNAVR